jgi:hypothetical protein
MFENLVKFVLEEHVFENLRTPLGEAGDTRLLDPGSRPIPTRDGYVCISANTNAQAFAFSTPWAGPN